MGLILAVGACSGSDEPNGAGNGSANGSGNGAVDMGNGATDQGAGMDSGAPDQGSPDLGGTDPDLGPADMGPPGPDDVCKAMGLPRDPFDGGQAGFRFGERAGDFTVTELDGFTWQLSQNWTGCESYVFFPFIEGTASEALWNSGVSGLLDADPDNVQYFFVSNEASESARRQRLERLRNQVQQTIGAKFPSALEADRQFLRFHFVIEQASQVEGSVGDFFRTYDAYRRDPSSVVDLGDRGQAGAPPLVVFGIDREQRWDSGGNPNAFVGGPARLQMYGYLGDFYNHKAELRHQTASETDVDKFMILNEEVTERIFVRSVELPDASAMANYDTMEFDVTVNCRHGNVFGCSEWDRIGFIELCLDGEGCEDRRELARWITPYWRRGERRWIWDATPTLPLVAGGGQTWIRIVMGPGWERKTPRDARFELRLSRRSSGPVPVGAVRAFTGGNWDSEYNASKAPFTFTPPATATRVELAVIVSGHGDAQGSRCSEWCDHRHEFAINGSELPQIDGGMGIGSGTGCADEAARLGVPPGQWGNWSQKRAYWCPGLPVAPIVLDMTDQVVPGQENTLTYTSAFYNSAGVREDPAGGNISMTAYVVWYE